MASGDTKTEAMLNALGNGGSADEFRGCCNTKTQQYILDAIDRVQNVEDEVEELKNNPDVVDIVDTYADLQAYDTQHLTENDIIRVLQDETHSGNSTYYRFTKNPDTWTFIGEIAGAGGDIKTLSTDDYNYPTNNPDRVALWLLPNGLYRIPTSGVSVYYASNSIWAFGHGDFVIIEKYQAGAKPISMYFFGSTDGVEYCEVSTSGTLNRALAYTILSDRVSQSTGNDQYSVMSQNAVTSMVFADPSTMQKIKIGAGTYANSATNSIEIGRDARAQSSGGVAIGANSMLLNSLSHSAIAIGDSASAYGDNAISIGQGTSSSGTRGIAIGGSANATQNGAIALGYGSSTSSVGEMNIGSSSTSYGYNSTNYRLLSGLYDGQSAHDAATVGQINATIDAINTALSTNISHIGA